MLLEAVKTWRHAQTAQNDVCLFHDERTQKPKFGTHVARLEHPGIDPHSETAAPGAAHGWCPMTMTPLTPLPRPTKPGQGASRHSISKSESLERLAFGWKPLKAQPKRQRKACSAAHEEMHSIRKNDVLDGT